MNVLGDKKIIVEFWEEFSAVEASKVIYTKKTEDDINITRSDPQPSCCREFDKSDRINSQDSIYKAVAILSNSHQSATHLYNIFV